MLQSAILFPLFAQVALTFGLLGWLGVGRVGAVTRREVRLKDIALGQKAWGDRLTALSNSYSSQFELPVLFYAVIAFAIVTGYTTGFQITLAWAFVALRYAHAAIYNTTNNLRHRLAIFTLGALVLLVMWIALALQVLSGGV